MKQKLPHILVAALLFSTVAAFADDDHGRLQDGRAFRKDAEGNKMVDYIAELELEVDSLRRQVQGLEGERDSVELKLASKSPEGCQIPLKEKNLVGGDKGSMTTNYPKCEEKICPTVSKDCSAEVTTAAEACTGKTQALQVQYTESINSKDEQIAKLTTALHDARVLRKKVKRSEMSSLKRKSS